MMYTLNILSGIKNDSKQTQKTLYLETIIGKFNLLKKTS